MTVRAGAIAALVFLISLAVVGLVGAYDIFGNIFGGGVSSGLEILAQVAQ